MYQGQNITRETNPRQNAGPFSIITFLFTYDIFKKGIRKDLEEDDVYEILKDYRSHNLGDDIEREWDKERIRPNASLIRALFRIFGKKYAVCGVVQLIVRTSFMVIKPLATGRLVAYFTVNSNMTQLEAYFYAAVVIGITVLLTVYNHGYMLYIQQMAQKIRICLCSVMYRKSLKLNTSALAQVKNGQIVTLMAKDVNLFDSAIIFAHDLWIGVIQVGVMTCVMYRQIGVSAIYGIGFLVMLIPLQLWIGKQTTKTRLKTAAKSDERIRLIQEVLSTIQIIKIYTWENYFCKLVDYLRKSEIGKLKIIFYLKATILSIGNLSTRISFYICMMTYISGENHITAEKAFVVLGCYGSLRSVLTIAIPLGISQIADLRSSIKRIERYLLTKEVQNIPQIKTDDHETKIEAIGIYAEIAHDKPALHDINLELSSGLYGLTGHVGSGKSTLLKLFLEDVTITEGRLKIDGILSYASQEPWLFPGTIRQNILFGLPLVQARYYMIINICGLRKDFDSFARGDNTLVNDRGLNLSRGQQSRINLARAVYKQADIYLLDNPLAALDVNVGAEVFEKCVKQFLKGKLCILVTDQPQFLEGVDTVLVMQNGSIAHKGTYEYLERSGVQLKEEYELEVKPEEKTVDYLKAEEEIDDDDEASELLKSVTSLDKLGHETEEFSSSRSIEKSSASIHARASKLYSETKKIGKVAVSVYKTYFKYAGGFKTIPVLLVLYVIGQATASYFDYFVTYWIEVEQKLVTIKGNLNDENSTALAVNATYNDTVKAELGNLDKIQSNVPMIYTIILSVTAVAMLTKSFLFFGLTSMSSLQLHRVSFSNLINARMVFFDINLTGNILNRFSKDFAATDEYIPYIIFECLRILFILIGVLVVISVVNAVFILLSFAFGVVLFILRHYYLPTSRSLKRLDGTTRSPVIGHLNASLEGLATIRASGAQEILKSQFDRHQDLHSSTAYMYLTTNRAFGFFLDMLCSLYITIIILSFIIFTTDTSAGRVGLAITQAFGLTGLLQWGIRQWAELENQMTSVERVLEYTEVKTENRSGNDPADWPSKGRVEYTNVRLRYPKTNAVVLHDISFAIEPREKIGIIGRTGSGKTSIISALFRLYDIESGSITVDHEDIRTIGLDHVRSKISIIPQNPILFSGTLRSNLDPEAQYSDKDLWRALEEVEMKAFVVKLDFQLDCIINEGGSNFSAGQKQLICLARAILRHNKILILDEATANIDPQTDVLIQNTISRVFSECTILTIAHRLNNVSNSDKVMVVDSGNIIEFDKPSVLLNNEEGAFYQLMSQAGLLQN